MSSSVAPECNEKKESVLYLGPHAGDPANVFRRYDSCFLKWYSEKFLRGNAKDDDCADLFKNYQGCLRVCSDYLDLVHSSVFLTSLRWR